MSLNRLLADQPQPEIAGSATLLGTMQVGAGAILAQGVVVRARQESVSIGNHSAVLENGVVIGTPAHPVRIGQRTVFGHRALIVGATVGNLCEIGNGAILLPGAQIGDGSILGEGTLVPAGAVIPPSAVLVGRPPHVIRSATDADRERLAVLREHHTDLTDYPGHRRTAALQAGAHMGTLYAYRDKQPVLGAGTALFDSAEITGDVVVGEDTLIGIGPGAMIHGCHIGRGSVVEPAAIVCDWSRVGEESVVRAGACVKQRDTHPPRSVLDGFPARAVDSLAEAPGRPGWALPSAAVDVIRRIDR